MENQVEKNANVNPTAIILLLGTIFFALMAVIASGTILGVITGAIVGLVIAIIFVNFILPHKPHDR
ncbi:hypothetical protein [Sphingobacterium gobiense]|uniref:Uncharacterized protein n=1 Tax=Sphingobacterium gobiense TaxID=1382456 RepID=A0A2S9JKU1_9SPHI|nr:hypothetical protein [Sphingobacterium gobiense]PRD53752.1 hypothetical protein C5749_09520 [Sphingobacterium gobiense]